jgi:hypothetical protein
MWNIDPKQLQATLYMHTNIYRTRTQKWDWWRRPREEEKKEERWQITMKYITSLCEQDTQKHNENCFVAIGKSFKKVLFSSFAHFFTGSLFLEVLLF